MVRLVNLQRLDIGGNEFTELVRKHIGYLLVLI